MPGYKAHMAVGTVVFVALLVILSSFVLYKTHISCLFFLEIFGVTLLGSLFPDIDTKSKGQLLFYQIVMLLTLFLMFYQKWQLSAIFLGVSLLPLLVHHRGLFHKLWFIGVVGAAILYGTLVLRADGDYYAYAPALFFMAGAYSHILLDRYC